MKSIAASGNSIRHQAGRDLGALSYALHSVNQIWLNANFILSVSSEVIGIHSIFLAGYFFILKYVTLDQIFQIYFPRSEHFSSSQSASNQDILRNTYPTYQYKFKKECFPFCWVYLGKGICKTENSDTRKAYNTGYQNQVYPLPNMNI